MKTTTAPEAPTEYRIRKLKHGSSHYGNCEFCQQFAATMFLMRLEQPYRFKHGGEIHEGKSHRGNAFGHSECLEAFAKQKGFTAQ